MLSLLNQRRLVQAKEFSIQSPRLEQIIIPLSQSAAVPWILLPHPSRQTESSSFVNVGQFPNDPVVESIEGN
jgi:hypothetical protein